MNQKSKANGQLQNISSESSVNGYKSHMENGESESHSGDDKADHVPTSNGFEEEEEDSIAEGSNVQGDEEEIGNSHPFEDDADADIWEYPEPEDPNDDLECSVAHNDDDDDDEGDGTQWGRPSSLSPGRGEGNGWYKFKDEKERAMDEVFDGKFKALVCQLLKSIGISPCGDDGEAWGDIVTTLSRDAASFLKPDAVVRKSMAPDGYVKVKCIATGVRSQR